MSAITSIEWTHRPGTVQRSWNPTKGCSRISPGCVHCYAERVAARFSRPPAPLSHAGPFHGFAIMKDGEPHWTGKVELNERALMEPLKWRKPSTVFVNSMSDLFHEKLTDRQIDRVFAVMALCQQHTFIVLTKRDKRMAAWFDAGECRQNAVWAEMDDGGGLDFFGQPPSCGVPQPPWPLPNVWLGVSVEDRKRLGRIEALLNTPAAVRLVSLEPLLEDLGDIGQFLPRRMSLSEIPGSALNDGCTEMWTSGIDWAIIGGESGPGARPMNMEWARSIIDQCRARNVKVFVKQMGSQPMLPRAGDTPVHAMLRDPNGRDPSEWPEWARIREFPA